VSGKLNTAHDQVDVLAGITHQIATAISEQTNVSTEIDQNVVRLNDAACNILDELDRLKNLTDNLDLTANEIYQELGKFKV
jgi:methyl-accepting chemotaxis protein